MDRIIMKKMLENQAREEKRYKDLEPVQPLTSNAIRYMAEYIVCSCLFAEEV